MAVTELNVKLTADAVSQLRELRDRVAASNGAVIAQLLELQKATQGWLERFEEQARQAQALFESFGLPKVQVPVEPPRPLEIPVCLERRQPAHPIAIHFRITRER